MKRFMLGALAALVIGGGLGLVISGPRAGILLKPTTSGGGGAGIAFVTSADMGNVSSGNLTANCTVGSGANRMLLVFGAGSFTGADTVTGITYNGVAMTRAAAQSGVAGSARTAYLYYLLAPASGTNSVVVSQTGGDNLLFGCADYTGAKQSAQPDSSATVLSGSPTTSTLATTVVAANSWVVTVGTGLNAVPTVTGGTNTRRTSDAGFNTWVFGDSNAAEAAGSYSMTVNWPSAGSLNIRQIVASFSPAP